MVTLSRNVLEIVNITFFTHFAGSRTNKTCYSLTDICYYQRNWNVWKKVILDNYLKRASLCMWNTILLHASTQ